jgi:hypothetical protein
MVIAHHWHHHSHHPRSPLPPAPGPGVSYLSNRTLGVVQMTTNGDHISFFFMLYEFKKLYIVILTADALHVLKFSVRCMFLNLF